MASLKPQNPLGFPAISDYGFVADGETAALIAPSGAVEWMCLPRFDSPAVFGQALDRSAGYYRVGPADTSAPAGRRYIPGTMILETTWHTKDGWLLVRDLLLVGPWHDEKQRSKGHKRAPTDYDADHVLLRMVKCLYGEVQLSLDCKPIFDYGATPAAWSYLGDDYHSCQALDPESGLQLQLVSDMNLGIESSRAVARTLVREGEEHFACLSWSEHAPPKTLEEAESRLLWTSHHWRNWLARGNFPDHPWREHLERSALTLKGLTYAPTGALLAAPTTSLPEEIGGERNWDYRYTWIRDSVFMLWGLYTLGFSWEANDFFSFLMDAAKETGDLQIMYAVDGAKKLEERELNHLSGYEDSRPVRIGNAAYKQKQHDVWGIVLDAFYMHASARNLMLDDVWPMLQKQVEHALDNWQGRDQGIWESRGPAQHFTFSKVMCWIAVDRGAKLAELRGDMELAQKWRKEADVIHADICKNGVDKDGVFVQHYETEALDASLLLLPLLGFLPPEDPRIVATVMAIRERLTEDGLVLRNRPEETDDGISGSDATFTICSFWLVSALVTIGETEKAKDLCEWLLSFASPLLLYAEEIDPNTGRHLGNFPQAFTHLALINAVMQLIEAEES